MDYEGGVDGDDSDDELLAELDFEAQIVFMMMNVCINSWEFFNPNELEDGGQVGVNPDIGIRDLLASMRATGNALFKNMTNFSLEEFDKLCVLVCPLIHSHARSTGEEHILSGRPSKLTPEQRLCNFIMYMKHDNVCTYDGFQWNWSRTALNDDCLFVASCINRAIANEITWPNEAERARLGRMNTHFSGCIGIIDGTLVRIRRPYKNPVS